MSEFTYKKKLHLLSVSALFALALPATHVVAQEDTSLRQLEEVLVSARRREEIAQETPLTVSVFDAESIEKAGIREIADLNMSVPGINMISAGTPINTVFSIRGVSRATSGSVQPAVSVYVNDVPLTIWGASIPTYDMKSLQVLKGPQGTLFGRNATTGAVIATTQEPSHEFGGYISATVGNYNARLFEAAIDLPVLKDKIALRLAGQSDKRDGYTKDMVFGDDLNNKERENFRVSILLYPSDGLRNVFVYDKTNDDSEEPGNVPLRSGPGLVNNLPFTNGTSLDGAGAIPCNGNPVCDFDVLMDRQQRAGIRKIWPSVNQFSNFERILITNTTT